MRRLTYLAVSIGFVALFTGGPLAKTQKGPFYYLSPLPGAELVSRQTTVIFRPTAGFKASRSDWTGGVTVSGTRSGVHHGQWVTSRDTKTVIFKPQREFEPGEVVRVTVGESRDSRSTGDFSFSFTISPKTALSPGEPITKLCDCVGGRAALPGTRKGDYPKEQPQKLSKNLLPGTFELPSDFPDITITTTDNPSPGHIFLSNFTFPGTPPGTPYMMILDNTGFPVYFQKAPGRFVLDFKKQPDGRLSYFVFGGKYLLMDNTYTVVDSFWVQGFGTDIHDLQILPNGNALITGFDNQTVDMSAIVEGGNPEATVVGLIVQELDPDKNVLFEWRSWDHFDILDATHLDFTEDIIDYVHVNSIELSRDGHILISSRHMDEITKINRDTGDIIWRLGGKNNEFTLVDDTVWFSHQHSCRQQESGTITLHDNGNFNDPRESRAVEYEIDEGNRTATRIWEYRNDPATLGTAMGNLQRLPNGNTVIGWGSTNPNLTEVRPDGSKAFEMTFSEDTFSYRSFRFEWAGVAAAPYLWAETQNQSLTLHFTKFGDEDVEAYNIYWGQAPNPTEPAGNTGENTFEVRGFAPGTTLYFRVTAVDDGGESPFSNEISLTPDFSGIFASATVEVHPRTLNLKSNGRWISAYIEVTGECECSAADVDVSSVMLNDAVPAESHPASVGDEDGDGTPDLMVKFSREAVQAILDVGDDVELKVTGSVGEARFEAYDHIRVIQPGAHTGGDGEDSPSPAAVLHQNLPNPFNPITVIGFTVPAGGGRVSLRIYDAGGRLVRTLVDGNVRTPGERQVTWDGRNTRGTRVASGIYFYRLQGPGFSKTRKMVLLK